MFRICRARNNKFKISFFCLRSRARVNFKSFLLCSMLAKVASWSWWHKVRLNHFNPKIVEWFCAENMTLFSPHPLLCRLICKYANSYAKATTPKNLFAFIEVCFVCVFLLLYIISYFIDFGGSRQSRSILNYKRRKPYRKESGTN